MSRTILLAALRRLVGIIGPCEGGSAEWPGGNPSPCLRICCPTATRSTNRKHETIVLVRTDKMAGHGINPDEHRLRFETDAPEAYA
jgi:hypothetical protein